MNNFKANWLILWVVTVLLCGISPGPASAGDPKLAEVIYITQSKPCGCGTKNVRAADTLVDQIFTGQRRAMLKRIDYDTDRQAAVPYIGEYHLIRLPALIFLDAQKHMLWMAVGEVANQDIAAKLAQFGG